MDRRIKTGGKGAFKIPAAIIFIMACLLAGCSSSKKPETDSFGAPVLLITLDTTRADRLGCYGSGKGLTPFLDGFSQEAYLFSNCQTPVPMTLPAHTSLFSGLYPVRTMIQTNLSPRVPEDVPLLAEEFGAAGYCTAAFVSSNVLLRRYGLDSGFEVYDESFYDPRKGQFQRAGAQRTLALAESWLEGRKGAFFCWIHLFDPHFPYDPPEPWHSRHAGAPYDGAVAYMDACLGDFFRKPALRDWKNWHVVVCGDHGESLGEHGESKHGNLLYEGATRVPLLIHVPGQQAGKKLDDWTSLVDVAPTLRKMTGLEEMECDGVSLQPLFGGARIPERQIFMETVNGTVTYGWAPLFGVVEKGWKFIQAPRPELYDLKNDPGEKDNRIGSDKALEAGLKDGAGRYSHKKPVGTAGKGQTLSGTELEQLAGLGYIQAGFSRDGTYDKDPKDHIGLVDKYLEVTLALQKRDHGRAEKLLAEIESADKADPYLFFLKGELESTRNRKKAEECFAKAVELAPAYGMAWSIWIRNLLNDGKLAEAASVAGKAMRVCRDDMGYFNLALAEAALYEKGDHQSAKRYLETALSLVPDMGRAHLVYFEMHMREGLVEKAQEDLKKVREFTPEEEVYSWQKDPLFAKFFEALFREESKPAS